MSNWIRRSQTGRGLFALLVLCALVIRVAIPTGFMPTQSAHGIVISLCTGQGAVKALLPIEKRGEPADHKEKGGECIFAAGLGGGLLATASSAVAEGPIMLAPAVAGRAIAHLTVHRLAAPPPPAQAPPARA